MEFKFNNTTVTADEIRNLTDEELKKFLGYVYRLGYNEGSYDGIIPGMFIGKMTKPF